LRRPAFYTISTRCNLKCNGCYFFAEDDHTEDQEEPDVRTWQQVFSRDVADGATIAYFVGAEAALAQEKIAAARPYYRYGVIGTNGLVKMDPAIPYRIHVSAWGDGEEEVSLRGAKTFDCALTNYAGDPRALVVFTLNGRNISSARNIVRKCHEHGIDVTFSFFSPPSAYSRNLKTAGSREYGNEDLRLTPGHLKRIRETLSELMEEYPDNLILCSAYNEWITQPGPRFQIDPQTGVAMDCHSLATGSFMVYGPMAEPLEEKCCLPELDCSECRIYSATVATRLTLHNEDLTGKEAFGRWLEIIEQSRRIALPGNLRDSEQSNTGPVARTVCGREGSE
jgi:hypothetical protein